MKSPDNDFKIMIQHLALLSLLMLGTWTSAAQPWPMEGSHTITENAVEPQVHAFPLNAVRLLEGPFLDAMRLDAGYLVYDVGDALQDGRVARGSVVPGRSREVMAERVPAKPV